MGLAACYRWVKGTDEPHVFTAAAQNMTVIVVEGIYDAIVDFMDFASAEILDGSSSRTR